MTISKKLSIISYSLIIAAIVGSNIYLLNYFCSLYESEIISCKTKILLSLILIIPSLVMAMMALISFHKEEMDINYIRAFIPLLVFYLGFFGVLKYVLAPTSHAYIPMLNEGTIGFRAWGAKVYISDVTITYISNDDVIRRVSQEYFNKKGSVKFIV
ncbi:membrane hypothetical protein [uncultured Desulfobacterium sp.]|uniref:Uncharacterized protein n=1 Tax=uncultured Desulfobacterium sp. TaxID=201089 RepID=A0A445MQJ9_9BACT|nr:membrane hypothetical protein [uncultured Desulfobacterium sp.]